MIVVPNNNPNLYRFIGVVDNRFILAPIVAFRISDTDAVALDIDGKIASVTYDKNTGFIYRPHHPPVHIDTYAAPPAAGDDENGVFTNGR